MNTLKLAWRGLTRNRRRSLVTLFAIAFGFAAIMLFAGYTYNTYQVLARQAVHGELLGHLTINKIGMRTEGKLDPERYMLMQQDIAQINAIVQSEPQVKLLAPRLSLSGMTSNGRASTIFIADAIEPHALNILQGDLDPGLRKKLDPAQPTQVLFSQGLAELLHLNIGQQAVLFTNTLSGQANALDGHLAGVFRTGNANSNDKFIMMPLNLAQSLYDVPNGADRLTVLLDDIHATETVRNSLQAKLKAMNMEVKTWQELSDFYNQVRNMFDMIFGFIFSIVLIVIVMSIINSMSMTVIERTREIGTLRAIGMKRQQIVRLFVAESVLLSLLGCVAGLTLGLLARFAVNAAHISYTPPNSDSAINLFVDIDIERTVFTLCIMLLVGAISAYLPARRAAKQPIVNALGHV